MNEYSQKPTHRCECRNMPRPCPFVSCRYHLYLDVDEKTGSIQYNFPDLSPLELKETCVLDVAEKGGQAHHKRAVKITGMRYVACGVDRCHAPTEITVTMEDKSQYIYDRRTRR